jgi:type VI secretion system secreted protein VgrG
VSRGGDGFRIQPPHGRGRVVARLLDAVAERRSPPTGERADGPFGLAAGRRYLATRPEDRPPGPRGASFPTRPARFVMPPNRDAAVMTSLGDVFRLVGFVGRDALSEPFSYQLEVTATEPLEPQKLLGEAVVVVLFETVAGPRFFHGHVTAATYVGVHRDLPHWRIDVGPWLAFLRHRVNCRHFLDRDAVTILETVFADYGPLATFENRCRERPPRREYTCQFNEDDFSFVCRLLQREGIYFYFEHGENEHTLILDDDSTLAKPAEGYAAVPFRAIDAGTAEAFADETLTRWTPTAALRAGKWVTRNFDFTNPLDLLEGQRSDGFDHRGGELEVYAYPDLHLEAGEGNTRAQRRLEAAQADARLARGEGNVRGLGAGRCFTLEGVDDAAVGGDWLVRTVTHVIRVGEERSSEDDAGPVYGCSVEAQPLDQPFRPPRRFAKPSVPGPQTAIVVGPDGEEVHCDEHGRVKLRFHWDRYSESHEDSSPWVRCTHFWASAGFGGFHLPRVGDEVLVTFLDGDPDRPVVTGRVYNGLNAHPYPLPANRNRSGVKSQTVGGSGFNEISYDDTSGEEELFVHAQRDMKTIVKRNNSRQVDVDETLAVGQDRKTIIKRNHDVAIKDGDETVTLDKGSHVMNVDTGDHTVNVKAGDRTLNVQSGDDTVNVDSGDHTVNVRSGGAALNVNSGSREVTVPAASYKVTAGKVELMATQQLTLQCGAGKISINAGGMIDVQGTMVNIKGGLVKINS